MINHLFNIYFNLYKIKNIYQNYYYFNIKLI